MAGIIEREAIKRLALTLSLVGLGFAGSVKALPGSDNRAPDLGDCQDLQVPEGHKVAFYAYAEGVQVYRWDDAKWSFVGPEAVLYAGPEGGVIGTHYAGPTWETISGSYVIATVLERCTPNPNAIPWLKLEGIASDGSGPLAGVTFIQRVNTTGGLAPAQPGEFTGDIARVPYTADYFFYRLQQ